MDINIERWYSMQLSAERSTLVDEWLFGCQTQAPNLTHKFGEHFRVASRATILLGRESVSRVDGATIRRLPVLT